MKRKNKRALKNRRYLLIPVGIFILMIFTLSITHRSKNTAVNLATSASQLFTSSSTNLYNNYQASAFVLDNERMVYNDPSYSFSTGIDVSEHNGDIDWNKVKADGIDFVFLRIGYRGYGDEGTLQEDANFETNYKNAKKAGLKIGVYFFSQAVNETEAEEEADFVLKELNGKSLDLPIAYDVESISDDTARTDNVTGDQFTSNIQAFSLKIADAGYTPLLYVNLHWELFTLDMSRLENLPIWYSAYETTPSTSYRFDYWQYSNTGTVDGIEGDVDMNIALTKL